MTVRPASPAGPGAPSRGRRCLHPEALAGRDELPWGLRGSRVWPGASEQAAIGRSVCDLRGIHGPVLSREVEGWCTWAQEAQR